MGKDGIPGRAGAVVAEALGEQPVIGIAHVLEGGACRADADGDAGGAVAAAAGDAGAAADVVRPDVDAHHVLAGQVR